MTQAGVLAEEALPAIEARHRDPMKYPPGVFYADGQYLPMSEAKVSVLDYGFLHSDVTYDTVHVWQGRFFRLDLHLDRFFGGVDRLRMTLPFGRDSVRRVLMNCVALSGLRELLCGDDLHARQLARLQPRPARRGEPVHGLRRAVRVGRQ